MAKHGLAIKPESRIALQLHSAVSFKKRRDESLPNAKYMSILKDANETLSEAIKTAEQDPEGGLLVAEQCARFILEALPDAEQDDGRAVILSQFETLEYMLAVVRKPGEYLTSMQKRFGPKLDPRDYDKGDAFNSIITSQRNRIYKDGQSGVFAGHEEKLFCRKQRELLSAVEKGYNGLRDQALGLPPKTKSKGRGR
jgi:hypothetical protein